MKRIVLAVAVLLAPTRALAIDTVYWMDLTSCQRGFDTLVSYYNQCNDRSNMCLASWEGTISQRDAAIAYITKLQAEIRKLKKQLKAKGR